MSELVDQCAEPKYDGKAPKHTRKVPSASRRVAPPHPPRCTAHKHLSGHREDQTRALAARAAHRHAHLRAHDRRGARRAASRPLAQPHGRPDGWPPPAWGGGPSQQHAASSARRRRWQPPVDAPRGMRASYDRRKRPVRPGSCRRACSTVGNAQSQLEPHFAGPGGGGRIAKRRVRTRRAGMVRAHKLASVPELSWAQSHKTGHQVPQSREQHLDVRKSAGSGARAEQGVPMSDWGGESRPICVRRGEGAKKVAPPMRARCDRPVRVVRVPRGAHSGHGNLFPGKRDERRAHVQRGRAHLSSSHRFGFGFGGTAPGTACPENLLGDGPLREGPASLHGP